MKIIAALAICLVGTAASAQTLDDLKNDGKKPTTSSLTAWAITFIATAR